MDRAGIETMLSSSMNRHFTCGIAAAECHFGKKAVEVGNYELIPNAIEVEHFRFNAEIRNRLRKAHGLDESMWSAMWGVL